MSTLTTEPSVSEVDAAVRSVIAELMVAAKGKNRLASSPSRQLEGEVFGEKLLSLREAERLPEGVRAVLMAPSTVVTPLARDYLKRLGVEIRYHSRTAVDTDGSKGEWGLAMEVSSGIAEAFRRSLLEGPEPWRELGSTLDQALDWVLKGERRGALVLTDEASWSVFRACQISGIRAAAAEEPGTVSRAVRGLGVNVLVVEPAGKSIALLKQIGQGFRRAGGPRAPEWLSLGAAGGVR